MFEVPDFCSHLPAGITGWFGLEGTLQHTQSQAPARDREGTTSPGCTGPHPTLGGSHNPSAQGGPTGNNCLRVGNPDLLSTGLAELKLLSQEIQMDQGQSRAGGQTAQGCEEVQVLLWGGDALSGPPSHI